MKSKEFYKTTAWKWFTKYVLLSFSNNGVVYCITCGKWMDINSRESCTGHLIKVFDGNRTNFSIAFEIKGVAPQCQQCNRYCGGKPDIMYRKLVELHGQKAIDDLYLKKNFPLKLDAFTLDLISKEYKEKYKGLLKTMK